MRLIYLPLLLLLLGGCRNVDVAPKAILVPPAPKVADTEPVGKSIDGAREAIAKARTSVTSLEVKLQSAEASIATARAYMATAYAEGLVAGSEEARKLQAEIESVEKQLRDTKLERNLLHNELSASTNRLDTAKGELSTVRAEVAVMAHDATVLRASIAEANDRITKAELLVARLKTDLTIQTEHTKRASWWAKFWCIGFVSVVALNAIYIAGKINGWGFIR